MIFWNRLLNTGYHLVKGFNGWQLVSRNKIAQTGVYHTLYNYNHGRDRNQLKEHILKSNNFICLDEFRFEIMDELLND